jgi:hypothetical protein
MTSHHEILASYAVVSIKTACIILGGDGEPVSPGTVYRLCREGRIERRGKGKITTASIRRYIEEDVWRDDEPRDRGVSTKRLTAGAPGANSRNPQTGSGGMSDDSLPRELRLVDRLPRGQRKP